MRFGQRFRINPSTWLLIMPRTFAYARVSTAGQTTENQLHEIEAAGFKVEARRIVAETISGSTAIARRSGFMRLMDIQIYFPGDPACRHQG